MRRLRWLVPLVLVLPLAAPAAPLSVHVEGRAYELRDDAPAPERFTTSLSPLDDGVTPATSRLLPRPTPLVPEPPSTDWSYGPVHYAVERPLESTSSAEDPATTASPVAPPPSATQDAPTTPPADTEPSEAGPDPGEGADIPEHDPDVEDDAGDPDAPSSPCDGLCFSAELRLL